MKRNKYFLICFLFCYQFLFAQKFDCEKIALFLNEKEAQIQHLNLHDPDYIPLHYLIAQDIIKELKQFRDETLPYFTPCPTLTFNEIIDKYDALKNSVQLKYDSLSLLNKNVYLIFYEKALVEYQFKNEVDGEYFLQRSLQYNATFPNAVLLKLNKLLDKNYFGASLSLLNTLYYETEMDREQEIQAIEFTDKFYDKLYKTGDSLIKAEHAAEALELFEILEAFCLNLPSSYCNDDYYHGLLRSKSGIYESYLTIAQTAEKRGNPKIAALFYQYAQEYLKSNPYLQEYEAIDEIVTKHVELKEKYVELEKNVVINVENVIAEKKATINIENITIDVKNVVINTENAEPKLSPKEMKAKYDKLVFQALMLSIKEEFPASYNMFLEAKKLEDCRCFEADYRVDLMLRELSKFELK
ncbi:MAG: hypothetical protein FWC34_07765 [Bacteroidetes bacterium]|nr:hypothetical protein [Bacteroidota bacterium]MCL2302511.1 hypothetical protein [Lentimicrobiaceae bacterium]